MTFTDLSNPEPTIELMKLYEKEYPGLFHWMGEVNLVKQAQFNNHHVAASPEDITQWAGFMTELRTRDYPITIHSDMGNDGVTYLVSASHGASVGVVILITKLSGHHMGLSYELTTMKASEHIAVLSRLLDQYPNLMLDISWRILDDYYFSKSENQDQYVAFMNHYSERILPGSGLCCVPKTILLRHYQQELEVTGRIHKYLGDKAFRDIALGQNYFTLLNLDYQAPEVCQK